MSSSVMFTCTPSAANALIAESTWAAVGVVSLRCSCEPIAFTVDYDVDALPVDQFGPRDLVIASRDLDGSHPWLDPREPVTRLHILRAAHKVDLPADETAARLALLGYPLEGWTEPE